MDYKYMMTERADEIAYNRYGMEFYDLPVDVQDKVFEEAINDVNESLLGLADGLERKTT